MHYDLSTDVMYTKDSLYYHMIPGKHYKCTTAS